MRYRKGPMISDLPTLVFCLMHGDHIYHGTTILPSGQLFTWPLSRLREKVSAGKIFFAEVA